MDNCHFSQESFIAYRSSGTMGTHDIIPLTYSTMLPMWLEFQDLEQSSYLNCLQDYSVGQSSHSSLTVILMLMT